MNFHNVFSTLNAEVKIDDYGTYTITDEYGTFHLNGPEALDFASDLFTLRQRERAKEYDDMSQETSHRRHRSLANRYRPEGWAPVPDNSPAESGNEHVVTKDAHQTVPTIDPDDFSRSDEDEDDETESGIIRIK